MSHVSANLPGDPASLKLHLLKLSSGLKSRVTHADQESLDFTRGCLKQVARLRGNQFVDLRYECAELCVPFFYGIGQLEDALEAALLMQELSSRTESRDSIRRAYNFVGIIRAELGDVSSAVIAYHRSLQLANEIGRPDSIAPVLINLGAVFYYGGLFQDAMATNHKGLSIAPYTERCDEFTANFCSNLALAHLSLGELQTAYQFIRQANGSRFVPATVKDFLNQVIRELLFVEIALDLGRAAEARDHLHICREMAVRSGSIAALLKWKLAQALVECHLGAVHEALKLLQECVEDSTRIGFQSRLYTLNVVTKGLKACGRPDIALRYFRDVLSSIRQQRQAQLQALISLDMQVIGRRNEEAVDLRALAYTEASLRAEAAELELANAQHDMLERLAITATLKEDPTGSHGYRVGTLSSLLAEELGWSRGDRYELETAARLHDIGKVAIPDSITLGERSLDQAERDLMRSHTIVGAELLSNSSTRGIQLAARVARFHHEWWNGTGYPAGLERERIPLACRIVALADVFDALTHGRRYAPAWSIDDSLAEISRLAGHQFDPELTPIFIRLVERLVKERRDLDSYLAAPSLGSPFFEARTRIHSLLETRDRVSTAVA